MPLHCKSEAPQVGEWPGVRLAPMGPILTIGHSTRPIEEFVRLLKDNGATLLADVRTIPRSRHNPQFNQEGLPVALADARLGYRHFPGLGGLRRPRSDSPNMGWHNLSFRGFADYMQTAEFDQHVEELIAASRGSRLAMMCAEAVPWRCHRSLIADALSVRGIRVEHIVGEKRLQVHVLTSWARVEGRRITYPPQAGN